VSLKEAEAKADEIDAKCSAYDFKGNNYVRVVTDEGLELIMPNAFALEFGDWYLLFAEHHDPMCFHKEDVKGIFEFSITKHQSQIKKVNNFKPVKKK